MMNNFLVSTGIYALLSLTLVPLVAHANEPVRSTKSTVKISTKTPALQFGKSRQKSYKIWHKMVMPNEVVDIHLAPSEKATIDGIRVGDQWQAPAHASNHNLVISNATGKTVRTQSIFVLEPSANIDKRGYLGDYKIGFYPKNTPQGFIKLEKSDMDLSVSPNFTVGQFICKQQINEWPKYLLVSDNNLHRLETLLARLKKEGRTNADTLFVMSGFRTPAYNTAIGSAKLSRHMYGDAADVYLDTQPTDGIMDDINGDGHLTKADANYLYDYAQNLFAETDVSKGGIGAYKANSVHGPFVHIDARGRTARWGR